MLYWILIYRIDLWLFVLIAFVSALYADLCVLKNLQRGRAHGLVWISTMFLVVVGMIGATVVGEKQRERLRVSIEGLAPTYGLAMQLMGHARLTLQTSPDDPTYLAIIERQKEWLQSNPAISDIYTMRRTPTNELAIMVDSETDYDRDGQFTHDRERRTVLGEIYHQVPAAMQEAIDGTARFDDVPATDRWGTWISAYTPMRDSQGQMDGIVGVDFAADDWVRTLLLSRGCVFGAVTTLLIGLVVIISVSHVQRAEIETQRSYAETMRKQALAVEEAMRQLRTYEFVLDTHALVYVTDRSGTIIHANQKLADLCGFGSEQLLGQSHRVIASHEEAEPLWNDMWQTVSDGRVWHGEVCNRARDGSIYWVDTTVVPYVDTRKQVAQYISMGTDITAKKRYEAELVRAARLDRLTGLPNRALFHERLKRTLERSRAQPGHEFAVMFLDFDRFKVINDSLGHEVGDLLLRAISCRLTTVVEPDDSVSLDVLGSTVARLGGDEFVVLVSLVQDRQDVIDLAERLLAAFDEPYQLKEFHVRSTASIGIVFSDGGCLTAEELLRDADTAMYQAKERGKAQYAVFDDLLVESLT